MLHLSLRMSLAILSSSVMLAAYASPHFAVGGYASGDDTTLFTLPMLVQTSDQGQSWASQTLPANTYINAALTTGSCSDSICVAGGWASSNTNHTDQVLLLQTVDGGNTWTPSNLTLTADDFWFIRSSCDDTVCVLVGKQDDNALIAQTTDAGVTWNSPDLSAIAPGGTLLDVACKDNFCVAVGYDQSDNSVIVQSFDSGNTWNQANLSNSLKGMLRRVDCDANTCTAVGFSKHHHTDTAAPLIVQSSSDKSLWTQVDVPHPHRMGQFNSISCNDTSCVAVGATGHKPMLAQSNGSSWSFITTNLPHASGYLYDVDCNDTQCVASGGSKDGKDVVLLTNASGSWSHITLPQEAAVLTVDCDNILCFAAGQKSDGSPLLFQSIQGGDWSTVTAQGMPDFGYFNEATSARLVK